MKRWSHKSLEWIHKIRELNYEKTRGKQPREIVEATLKDTEDLIKRLNPKLISPEDIIPTKRYSVLR